MRTWRSNVPPFFDGLFNDTTGIVPETREFILVHLDVPPWTTWIAARFVWIAVMFEFQVKANPMHLFEYIITFLRLDHRHPASLAFLLDHGYPVPSLVFFIPGRDVWVFIFDASTSMAGKNDTKLMGSMSLFMMLAAIGGMAFVV
jgi:hypothetical protein